MTLDNGQMEKQFNMALYVTPTEGKIKINELIILISDLIMFNMAQMMFYVSNSLNLEGYDITTYSSHCGTIIYLAKFSEQSLKFVTSRK